MDKSESITKLSAALVKAQSQMKPAPMNAVNPFLKNKYADLGAIIQTAAPTLNGNGLAYVQTVGGHDDQVSVTTMLIHESGEYISDTVSMATGTEKGKSAAQVAGSIVTYLRRYSLASICGIYADEDTDGNGPVGGSGGNKKPATQESSAAVWPEVLLKGILETFPELLHTGHVKNMLTQEGVDVKIDTPFKNIDKWVTCYLAQKTAGAARKQRIIEANKTLEEA